MSSSLEEIYSLYFDHQIFRLVEKPIRFVSGMLSPVYCDNRKILGLPRLRSLVLKHLAALSSEQVKVCEGVVGVATGGIPMATLLAHEWERPMAYVRKKAKDHGTQSLVEGMNVRGKPLLLFEDCLTTGQSAIDAIDVLVELGAKVACVLCLFDYGFLSEEKRQKINTCSWQSLIQFDSFIEFLNTRKKISKRDFERLQSWKNTT